MTAPNPAVAEVIGQLEALSSSVEHALALIAKQPHLGDQNTTRLDQERSTRRRSHGYYGYAPLAAQAYREREMRTRFFPEDLFGEACWNMLLDLMVQMHKGRQVSVTSACIASRVPATTALRWITVMIDNGLLIRTGDPVDRRRAFVELTPHALNGLSKYFEAVDNERRGAASAGE